MLARALSLVLLGASAVQRGEERPALVHLAGELARLSKAPEATTPSETR